MRFFLLSFFLIALTSISFLFSPKPDKDSNYYNNYIHLNSRMGFYVNGDTEGYIITSQHPGDLLVNNHVRQSRPLYILAGTIIGYPLQWIIEKAGISGEYDRNLRGFYLGYVLLNFIILFLSFNLFRKICSIFSDGKIDNNAMFGLLIFISSNLVTKAYFWTAHQQMFVFFTPLLCLYLMLKIREETLSFTKALILSFSSGILLLIYGSFILCLPCLVYALYISKGRFRHPGNYIKLIAFSSVFIIPQALWIVILRLNNVIYYNHEVEQYRQFVWVFDSAGISVFNFMNAFQENISHFLPTFRPLLFFISISFFLAIIIVLSKQTYSQSASLKHFPDIPVLIIILFVFLFFMGFYGVRLTFTFVPLILCLIYLQTRVLSVIYKHTGIIIILLGIGWHIINVMQYGPFD